MQNQYHTAVIPQDDKGLRSCLKNQARVISTQFISIVVLVGATLTNWALQCYISRELCMLLLLCVGIISMSATRPRPLPFNEISFSSSNSRKCAFQPFNCSSITFRFLPSRQYKIKTIEVNLIIFIYRHIRIMRADRASNALAPPTK